MCLTACTRTWCERSHLRSGAPHSGLGESALPRRGVRTSSSHQRRRSDLTPQLMLPFACCTACLKSTTRRWSSQLSVAGDSSTPTTLEEHVWPAAAARRLRPLTPIDQPAAVQEAQAISFARLHRELGAGVVRESGLENTEGARVEVMEKIQAANNTFQRAVLCDPIADTL